MQARLHLEKPLTPTARPEEPLGWEFRGREGCQSEALLLGCSTFSSLSDCALWRWLQDTAAMLGMTLPTPFTLEGREQAALGDGVEGTPEASDVHMHASWH